MSVMLLMCIQRALSTPAQTSNITLHSSVVAHQTIGVMYIHPHDFVLLFVAIVATFLTAQALTTVIYSITYGVYIMFSGSFIAYQSLRDKLGGSFK
jgi:hypothetical protein